MGGHLKARQASGPGWRTKKVKRGNKAKNALSLGRKMLGDVERVKAALRAGARPEMVYGRDSLTRRARKPDTIAHGPDGDVLILARFGRVTRLGRLWDEQRAERGRSRSPRGQNWETQARADSKC